ncbi:MAG: hypothetical protein RI924_1053, partial [Bacteroidota bacterium]
IIQFEVRRLIDLEFQIFIADLILSEILRLGAKAD